MDTDLMGRGWIRIVMGHGWTRIVMGHGWTRIIFFSFFKFVIGLNNCIRH